MFGLLIYWFTLFRLKWIVSRRKLASRFDRYSPSGADLTDEQATGLLASDSDWLNGCPNLDRNENINLIGSNTVDKTSLRLSLKWRPNTIEQHQQQERLQVASLLTKLSLEFDGHGYDYDSVQTYRPSESSLRPGTITQYGGAGSSLKLFVLDPYRRYRLIYRGQMRRRDQPSELKFIKLNCLIFVTSKVYDFQQQFSAASLAKQHAEKATRKLDIRAALDQFVLLDRHEHSVRFVGELMLRESGPSPTVRSERKTIHLWGFHSRQFVVAERDQQLRSKRVLAHFTNGRLFHVAACEGVDHLADADMRFTAGYGCFRIGPAVASLEWLGAKRSVDWTRVSSGARELTFHVATQERQFRIEATKREHPSEFHEFRMAPAGSAAATTTTTTTTTLPVDGWGFVLINDGFDTNEELFRLERSLRDYRLALEAGDCVHPRLFEAREFPSKPLIVDIDEKDCQFPCLVGSKAASLAQLKSFCAASSSQTATDGDSSERRPPPTVPDAIVLTRFVYEAIQASNRQLRDSIRSLEARAGRGDLDGFEAECERLQELVRREVRLPGELRTELERRLKLSFGVHDARASLGGKSFAVRSSSWGEDEDDMSAAGQLTTVLNVTSYERLLEALLECYASKFGHTNIEYKRQRGLPLDLPMAVVVQEMVDCDKAGVLFTCDPALGDEGSLIITANYGLGESVVSAQADPDTIRVVRANLAAAGADEAAAAAAAAAATSGTSELKIADIKVGSKQVVMRGGGDENANELLVDRSKCCLDEREIIELAGRALELVRYFGHCQRDLEWGIKAGRLYLLQSRPITGLDAMIDCELMHEGDSQSRAELEFVTRANVGEVMPYAMTPLQLSYSIRFWPIISGKIFERILSKRPEDYMLDFTPDLVTDCYHAFFCLRSKVFVNFAGRPEDRPLTARAMEIGLFGHEVNDAELSEKATEMDDNFRLRFAELRFDLYTWRSRYTPFKLNRDAKKKNAQIRRDINSLRFAGRRNQAADNQMEGLLEQLRVLLSLGYDAFNNHMLGTLISSKVNFELLQFLAKYCKEPAQLYLAFSKILASSPDVLSAEIPRRIERMAKLIAKTYPAEQVQSFATKCTPKEGLKFVTKDLKSELAQEFDQFMVKFGHRCYNEFEISASAWRDQPEKIIESLQSNVKALLGKEPAEIVLEEEPKKSLDQMIDSLAIPFSWLDRARLKYLLAPRCQMFVSVREQTKDNLIELVDIQRDASRLLARELRQNNRIPHEELLYFVYYRELAALVREPQPALVIQAARRRKVFRMMFKQAWRYDEIIKGHRLLPMHLAETKELDEKLARASKLFGTTASSGKARGRVCIVNGYAELNKIQPGDILVTYSTDIAFSPIFPLISGVITEIGGLISHGAVVAREYGLPSVIGIENATKILNHGEEILLDADNGLVVRLGMPADQQSAAS